MINSFCLGRMVLELNFGFFWQHSHTADSRIASNHFYNLRGKCESSNEEAGKFLLMNEKRHAS
jgi:hypothetical protein